MYRSKFSHHGSLGCRLMSRLIDESGNSEGAIKSQNGKLLKEMIYQAILLLFRKIDLTFNDGAA